MEPKRWQQIQKLFDEAAELKPSEQSRFLTERCGQDHELRQEVESLLAQLDAQDHHLKDAVQASANQITDTSSWIGKSIGAFEIVKKIDDGGMGSVFLGQRQDKEFTQQVAIKVLRSSLVSKDTHQRFLSERQILANLNHPFICQLLDGGSTDDGMPYLVMELVDGTPIDRFCDEKRLNTEARLQLFEKVCSAVAFAHQSLVVHRDIKPSNILVTEDGSPKLLDFGIAKLLDQEAMPHTIAVTQQEMRVLTPEFASPEQVRGEAITTATDVYSLGVLLYRLLSGHSPYGLISSKPKDIEKAILETDPKRPSTVVTNPTLDPTTGDHDLSPADIGRNRATSPNRLSKKLTGDLDNIVLMAMRKEPERRYQSPQALMDDIKRYLNHEPVSAQPDSWRYRSSKFVRRNALAVVATMVVAGLLTLFAAITAVQNTRIKIERDQANMARKQAEAESKKSLQVSDFLTSIFLSSSPFVAHGKTITALDLLEQAADSIDAELVDQPIVRADLFIVMAQTYFAISEYEISIELQEKAVDLMRSTPNYDRRIFSVHLDSAAGRYRVLANYDKAFELFAESDEIRQRVVKPPHGDYAYGYNARGQLYRAMGDYAKSEEYLQKAVNMALSTLR